MSLLLVETPQVQVAVFLLLDQVQRVARYVSRDGGWPCLTPGYVFLREGVCRARSELLVWVGRALVCV